jgi:hypothetical protein
MLNQKYKSLFCGHEKSYEIQINKFEKIIREFIDVSQSQKDYHKQEYYKKLKIYNELHNLYNKITRTKRVFKIFNFELNIISGSYFNYNSALYSALQVLCPKNEKLMLWDITLEDILIGLKEEYKACSEIDITFSKELSQRLNSKQKNELIEKNKKSLKDEFFHLIKVHDYLKDKYNYLLKVHSSTK